MTRGKPLGERRRMHWDSPKFAAENAWMFEHAKPELFAPQIVEEFQKEFGYEISPTAVKTWKGKHGIKSLHYSHTKMGRAYPDKPIGTERVVKPRNSHGQFYTLVKVRETPTKPGSKDNWEIKHVMLWEAANGKLPDGYVLWFADGDHTNMELDNLVPVPKKLCAILNNKAYRLRWSNAEELRCAIKACELSMAITDKKLAMPRKCGVCGKTFTPDTARNPKARRVQSKVRTCPECLDAGHKSTTRTTKDYTKKCVVCGEVFNPRTDSQRRCRACTAAKPKYSIETHQMWFRNHGRRD